MGAHAEVIKRDAHHRRGAHPGRGPHREHGSHRGHDTHSGHSVEMFRRKFWGSLGLTIPTLIWGHMLPSLFGAHMPQTAGARWIAPLFGTLVFAYGGRVFLQGAAQELRDRLPGMMTLISLAITVAFVFSAAVTLGYPGAPLWEELATLVTVMLLGHWIEMRSISQARGALHELAKLLPDTAVRETDGQEEELPVSKLRVGDMVLIKPGARVAADGVVRSGRSSVNEAIITGESRPVEKHHGERVIAGTLNGAGSLRVEITRTGEDTTLARISKLVEQAQHSRSRAQALADRAAFALTLVAVGAALLTAIAWAGTGAEAAFIVERVVSVLVVACPHALGLAIPLVAAISTTIGARSGLMIRNRRGLEEARNLDVVVFDKTGTLTLGEHRVIGIRTTGGQDADGALQLAAAVERDSEHPVARAIVTSAVERGLEIPAATEFRAIPGKGAVARVSGRELQVGGPHLLQGSNAGPTHDLSEAAADAARQGLATVYLLESGRVLAIFVIADAVRPESPIAVTKLHQAGIEVAMLTGDARAVAEKVGRELGIETVYAEVLPENKAKTIADLKANDRRVAMVGDGVNDAPALATSDVAIAIGAGTDVAVEAGDIVLMRSDPRDVGRLIALSRASYRKMVQNLWWAAGYNIVAIPLAAGVLAGRGILLPPAAAAVLMSVSTIIVALNAQLLRRTKLG